MKKTKSGHCVIILYSVLLTAVCFLTSSCKSAPVKDSSPTTSSEVGGAIVEVSTGLVDNNKIIESVKVEKGAVIIDGKYIERPYTIEAREDGIWINGVHAEKRTPRRQKYREARKITIQQTIEWEVEADYFEAVEKFGKEQASEKVKEQILNKGNIRGIKIKRVETKNPDYIEVGTMQDGDFNIRISTSSSLYPRLEQYMLASAINRKYRIWYKTKGDKEKEAYQDLVNFLDEQKRKGRIDEYKFTKEYELDKKGMLEIKYAANLWWSGVGSSFASTPEDITTIKYPSDEEADKLDRDSLQSDIETLKGTLGRGYLEVFTEGGHAYGEPGGERTIFRLKEIMSDKTLTLEERKKKIKEVYLPAQIEEEFLQQVIDNWER